MRKMSALIALMLVFACSHDEAAREREEALRIKAASVNLPPAFEKAQALVLKMTPDEKRQVLKSYLTLRRLNSGSAEPGLSTQKFFSGIPRLGIPSIEFVSEAPQEDKVSLQSAAPMRNEGEVLKLGTVNLIRNFEKEQVFENFTEAPRVDQILGPGRKQAVPEKTTTAKKLQDLDIFLVRSGSEETTVKDYICAIRRDNTREYTCVESQFEQVVEELGLKNSLKNSLEENKLTSSQVDSLVLRMLATMVELKIIT